MAGATALTKALDGIDDLLLMRAGKYDGQKSAAAMWESTAHSHDPSLALVLQDATANWQQRAYCLNLDSLPRSRDELARLQAFQTAYVGSFMAAYQQAHPHFSGQVY